MLDYYIPKLDCYVSKLVENNPWAFGWDAVGVIVSAILATLLIGFTIYIAKQQNKLQKDIARTQYNLELFKERYAAYIEFNEYAEKLNNNPYFPFPNDKFIENIGLKKRFEEIVICKLKMLFQDNDLITQLDAIVKEINDTFEKFTTDKEFVAKLTGDIKNDISILSSLIQKRISITGDIKKRISELMKITP